MITIPLEEAQAKLAQLIDALAPGEVLAITRNNQTVAKLVGDRPARSPRRPGNCEGKLILLSEDDDHLKDFEEYMS